MIFVGQIIYGYYNGYFDIDYPEAKRIEAFGIDWIVARGIERGKPSFATFDTPEEMLQCVSVWSVPDINS